MNCPYSRINDPYPGLCSLYIDENSNQICDRSEVVLGEQIKASADPIFWFIFIPAVLYFLHWYLVNKTTFLSKAGFKYFWNVSLLLLFIPAGVFGMLLGLGVSNQFLFSWHNNLGTSFVVISFFHLMARLGYFMKGLKNKN